MQVNGSGSSMSSGTLSSQSALNKTNKTLQKILAQLSTAKRMSSASDDAAGLGIAENLSTQARGFKVASQNIADASAALNIADGAARETSDLLQRQRELAVAAKNGTLSADNRKALNTEFQALSQEIGRLAQVTNYNRQNVANGTDLASGTAQIQVGSNAGESLSLPTVDLKAMATNLQSVSIATPQGADAALSQLDSTINSINSERSMLGATMNRLSAAGDNLAVAMVNTQAAESVIRDQNMAQGLAELTKTQILQEGAYKTFSRFNEINRNTIMGLLPQ